MESVDYREGLTVICPLNDSDGKPRTLATIEFDDLKQLEEIEEGYSVEYKSTWDKAVKDKLQKTVTSFANASGGWLFIGVNNDGVYSGITRTRSDFDQTIAQIVRHHVTPLPRFETRFIEDRDSGLGVLVVEVFEGFEPPYIADGSIFVRVGSSSEKYIKADSSVLIHLYRKARYNWDEIARFCHRTAYFPLTGANETDSVSRVPIIDVYLKRLQPKHDFYRFFSEIDEAESIMLRIINEYRTDYVCHHAHDSLQFRSSSGNHVDNAAPVIELFFDGSIKLSIPLAFYQSEHRGDTICRLQELRPIRNTNYVKVIDGSSSKNDVILFGLMVDRYLAEKERSLSDYALCFEYENMQGSIVKFDTDSYAEYVRNHGFPFVGTIDERSEPFIPDCNHDADELRLTAAVWIRFLDCLGLPASTLDEEKRNMLEDILGFSDLNKEEQE